MPLTSTLADPILIVVVEPLSVSWYSELAPVGLETDTPLMA